MKKINLNILNFLFRINDWYLSHECSCWPLVVIVITVAFCFIFCYDREFNRLATD